MLYRWANLDILQYLQESAGIFGPLDLWIFGSLHLRIFGSSDRWIGLSVLILSNEGVLLTVQDPGSRTRISQNPNCFIYVQTGRSGAGLWRTLFNCYHGSCRHHLHQQCSCCRSLLPTMTLSSHSRHPIRHKSLHSLRTRLRTVYTLLLVLLIKKRIGG